MKIQTTVDSANFDSSERTSNSFCQHDEHQTDTTDVACQTDKLTVLERKELLQLRKDYKKLKESYSKLQESYSKLSKEVSKVALGEDVLKENDNILKFYTGEFKF